MFTNNLNNIEGFGTLNIIFLTINQFMSRENSIFIQRVKYPVTGVHNEVHYKDWKNLDSNSPSN